MEPGGQGSFQTIKLQRPARATVCSHSPRDMAAMCSIESQRDHNGAHCKRLSGCEQIYELDPFNIAAVGESGDSSSDEPTSFF
jgi:hypothetical protein